MKWKKLIMLGDSLTQFGYTESKWVSKISDLLQRKCDVINRGFSGYTSEKIRNMTQQIFSEFKEGDVKDYDSICGVIILLGSNDSTEHFNLLQHVPVKRYKENMEAIIDYIISLNINPNKIILITPPKKDDERWSKEILIKYGDKNNSNFDRLVRSYADVCVQLALDKKIHCFDFNKSMEEYKDDYKTLLIDGLHLSEKGGSFLYENLLPILKKEFFNEIKFNFPYWKDLKPDQTEIDQ